MHCLLPCAISIVPSASVVVFASLVLTFKLYVPKLNY